MIFKCPKCNTAMEIYEEKDISFFDVLKVGIFMALMGLTTIGIVEFFRILRWLL